MSIFWGAYQSAAVAFYNVYLLCREYFKLDIAEREGAAGMDPAEFRNFKSETQENIDNCLTKIQRVLLYKADT